MSEEKKPSIVRSVVNKVLNSSEQMEKDVEKKLGKTILYQKITARLQEALVDSSLAIFNPDEDIEYRVLEAIALVNLRMTGLQGRTKPLLAQLHALLHEIIAEEWAPLLQASRMVRRRLAIKGSYDLWEQQQVIYDIVAAYGIRNVIPFIFDLLARSFGEEHEIVQFVVLATNVIPQQVGKNVTITGGDESVMS